MANLQFLILTFKLISKMFSLKSLLIILPTLFIFHCQNKKDINPNKLNNVTIKAIAVDNDTAYKGNIIKIYDSNNNMLVKSHSYFFKVSLPTSYYTIVLSDSHSNFFKGIINSDTTITFNFIVSD